MDQTLWIENWLSTVTVGVAKCTFFLLYLKIFAPVKWLRVGIYAGLIVTVVVYIAFSIALLVYITPHRGQSWLQLYQDPRSFDVVKLSVPLSCISLGIDLYIFLFPIVGVVQLQLSNKRKLGVIAIFMTGFW